MIRELSNLQADLDNMEYEYNRVVELLDEAEKKCAEREKQNNKLLQQTEDLQYENNELQDKITSLESQLELLDGIE